MPSLFHNALCTIAGLGLCGAMLCFSVWIGVRWGMDDFNKKIEEILEGLEWTKQ